MLTSSPHRKVESKVGPAKFAYSLWVRLEEKMLLQNESKFFFGYTAYCYKKDARSVRVGNKLNRQTTFSGFQVDKTPDTGITTNIQKSYFFQF